MGPIFIKRTTAAVVTLALAGLASIGAQDQPAERRVVHLVAERFVFVPSEITVEPGTRLEIRITSEDTDHGFRIVGPDGEEVANVTIPKRGRGEATVIFEAKEPGDYTFECSRMCGAGHSFMRGQIRVKPPGSGGSATGSGR